MGDTSGPLAKQIEYTQWNNTITTSTGECQRVSLTEYLRGELARFKLLTDKSFAV